MSTAKELVQYEEKSVTESLSSKDGLKPLIAQVQEVVRGFEHDVSTKQGRDKTASLAFKVSKFKTAIDGIGKDLVSDWKAKAKAVDANRKQLRDAMDALKTEARKPLDDWEEEQARLIAEEEARIEAEKLAIQKEAGHEIAILLNREHDRVKAEEKAKAERLEREAKEKAERERKEREERIAREAAETARINAEKKAKADAAAAALREAEAKAKVERLKREKAQAEARAKQAAIDAKLRQAKAVKEAEEKAKRDAEDKRIAEEKEAKLREADKRHRASVNNAALAVIMKIGISEAHGKELIAAIYMGKVPNVSINY